MMIDVSIMRKLANFFHYVMMIAVTMIFALYNYVVCTQ